ncbi:MAG: CoA ester lyase [Pseudomonadota bacterium]
MTTQKPLLRSVLYVPADNAKALAKSAGLPCDAVIYDLEDAVAPDAKTAAREALRAHFETSGSTHALKAIRINGLDTPWGTEDLLAARACLPDAIAMPKVDGARDLQLVEDALAETDAPESLQVWAMIETAAGVLNSAHTASHGGRLGALIVGTNDLTKDTGADVSQIHPWLMQIVLAGKAHGLPVLDGVFNDHRDLDGFDRACRQSVVMGFDGKTLIHPAQIDPANRAFAPSADAIAAAQKIVQAFALPDNAGKGVISLDGKMVERLHLDQALSLVEKANTIASRTTDKGQI